MKDIKESIPDKYTWESDGLFYMGTGKKIKIIDAVPEVITYVEKTLTTGKISKYLIVKLQYAARGSEARRYGCNDSKDIKKMVSELVQIGNAEPGRIRKAEEAFRYMICKQQADMSVVHEKEYEFGWNGKEFFLGDKEAEYFGEAKRQKYEAIKEVADIIIRDESNICGMLFLAAIQGTLKSIMRKIGADHDCVIYLVGETGTGKSDLARKFCDYIPEGNQAYTLDSNRKALKMQLAKLRDATVVIDDLCKTTSKGMYDKRLQTVSEIIQSASDAAPAMVDVDCKADFGRIHLVVTAEEKPRNPSTINRCLLLELDSRFPSPFWNHIGEVYSRNYIRYTVWNFVQYIMDDYQGNMQKLKSDYASTTREVSAENIRDARINKTFCVQMTVKNAVIRFARQQELPEDIVMRLDKKLSESIKYATDYTEDELKRRKKQNDHMECLSYFVDEILTISKDDLKKSERKYIYGEAKGMVLVSGYWSFDPKRICAQINEEYNIDKMNPVKLGKELRYYGLIHINGEGKNSCCFHSRKKWFHVNIRATLDFVDECSQMDEETKNLFWARRDLILRTFEREEG